MNANTQGLGPAQQQELGQYFEELQVSGWMAWDEEIVVCLQAVLSVLSTGFLVATVVFRVAFLLRLFMFAVIMFLSIGLTRCALN